MHTTIEQNNLMIDNMVGRKSGVAAGVEAIKNKGLMFKGPATTTKKPNLKNHIPTKKTDLTYKTLSKKEHG